MPVKLAFKSVLQKKPNKTKSILLPAIPLNFPLQVAFNCTVLLQIIEWIQISEGVLFSIINSLPFQFFSRYLTWDWLEIHSTATVRLCGSRNFMTIMWRPSKVSIDYSTSLHHWITRWLLERTLEYIKYELTYGQTSLSRQPSATKRTNTPWGQDHHLSQQRQQD